MAGTSSVDTFLANFTGGGARANRFNVIITSTAVNMPATFSFLCRGAQIPAFTVGNIDVPFMGTMAKVPGDRTIDDWMVSIYNDTTWDLRLTFETWIDRIMSSPGNVATLQGNTIYAEAVVVQLGRQNQGIANYNLSNIYPISVGAIDLNYENNNAVETFDVTFAVTAVTPASLL